MPRRRFSQGAIQPIREMLQDIEDEENHQIQLEKEELKQKRLSQQKKALKKKAKKKHEKIVKRTSSKHTKSKANLPKSETVEDDEEESICNTDDDLDISLDFADLSREEQLERLKEGEAKSSGKLMTIYIRICQKVRYL